jgi:hypothetical protein
MQHLTDLVAVSGIRSRQIGEADIPAVADLLAGGFKTKPRAFWSHVFARLNEHSTPLGFPKYGYLLENGGSAVGAIIQIFTAIPGSDGTRIRCNVSSWFVKDPFRSYASLLVSKALSHRNVTYVNVTPASHTLSIIEAQGYSQYSRGLFVAIPVLRFPARGTRVTAVKFDGSRPEPIDSFEHRLLVDHAKYGCLSLWCRTAESAYPFVFRPRVHKGIPCVQLVYCRSLDQFVQFAGSLGRFLIARGRLLVVIDSDGPVPGLIGKYFRVEKPKYFKGPDRPGLGDLAYTEVAMFGV